MPLVIGVTGSIATGKGLVCQALVEMGAVHSDADRVAHRLYDPGTPGFDRVVAAFGREVVGEDGYIDRRVLGGRVFGKPEEMRKLTTAIGDIAAAVRGVIDDWRATLGNDATCVMESVNHVEAGYGQWSDVTWLIACDQDLARQRLMARNGFTREEADQRLASQRSWEDRAAAADLVLFNNGTPEELVAEVKEEFRQVRSLWSSGDLPESRYQEWWRTRTAERQG